MRTAQEEAALAPRCSLPRVGSEPGCTGRGQAGRVLSVSCPTGTRPDAPHGPSQGLGALCGLSWGLGTGLDTPTWAIPEAGNEIWRRAAPTGLEPYARRHDPKLPVGIRFPEGPPRVGTMARLPSSAPPVWLTASTLHPCSCDVLIQVGSGQQGSMPRTWCPVADLAHIHVLTP